MANDSEGCPGSYSIYFQEPAELCLPDCVPVSPGTVYFGARLKGGVSGGYIRLRFWTDKDCSVGYDTTIWDWPQPTDWTQVSTSYNLPAGTQSAQLCFGAWDQYMDEFFINTSDNF
jgi:hypothetical protein